MKREDKTHFVRLGTTFLILVIFLSFMFVFDKYKLESFEITSFNQNQIMGKVNLITFGSSKHATKYRIKVYNSKNEIIKEKETTKTSLSLNDVSCELNEEITIEVIAVNKFGFRLKADNTLKFNWTVPSIESLDEEIENNQDLEINMHLETSGDYYLLLKQDNNLLEKRAVTSSKEIFVMDLFKDKTGLLETILVKKINNSEIVLSSLKTVLVEPKMTSIAFATPTLNATIPWEDFIVSFVGGNNADNYYLTIKDKNKVVINKLEITNNYLFDITLLQEKTRYEMTISATKKEETVEDSIIFKTGAKVKADIAFSNKESGTVYIDRTIVLKTTSKADIYYTIDGTTPSINSSKYDNPILITKDFTLKTIAIGKNYYDSDIMIYEYQATIKPIIIYLSPTTKSSGVDPNYESATMNEIADVIEKELAKKNITVCRNDNDMSVENIIKDSNDCDPDIHLMLHSNSGIKGGLETWVDSKEETTYSLAFKLHSKLLLNSYMINKGVREIKNSDFNIKEIENMNNGVLIEIGYINSDAAWISNNYEIIGKNIADTIITYFAK